jgi:hypothetical protein
VGVERTNSRLPKLSNWQMVVPFSVMRDSRGGEDLEGINFFFRFDELPPMI